MTYGGPYGQTSRWPIWECEDCGFRLTATYQTFAGERRWSSYDLKRMADHHACGHAPCPKCGTPLLRRMDGPPASTPTTDAPARPPATRSNASSSST